MKRAAISIVLLFASAALAQPGEHRGGFGGHFPSGPPHGPTPMPAPPPQPTRVAPPPQTHVVPPPPMQQRREPIPIERRPHVEPEGRWVGHEGGRDDDRYRMSRPWPRGRFAGPIGRGHVYRLHGWDAPRHRFWFGNAFFLVAPYDWDYVDDWNWDADDVVLYEDPDHPGWYLAYNTRLGTYAHVEYEGPVP